MVESGMMPEAITNDGDEDILQEDDSDEPDDVEEGDDADLEE